MYVFGSGVMTVTPSGSNPTPINIGLLQEGTVSFKSTTKRLYGQYRDPIVAAGGTREWSGKAKVARFSAQVMNAIFFGGTVATTGVLLTQYDATHSVPASPAYTITPTVPNTGTWSADQGVIFSATGIPFKRVASGPTAGQYSVSAGVYTFAAADASTGVTIAYNYTTAALGETIVAPAQLLGQNLNFALNFTAIDPTTNLSFTGSFPNCIAESFTFQTKLDDFMMPDFDFALFTNAAGSIGTFSWPDSL